MLSYTPTGLTLHMFSTIIQHRLQPTVHKIKTSRTLCRAISKKSNQKTFTGIAIQAHLLNLK